MRYRVILVAVIGIFITSELSGQRRSRGEQRARTESASEQTQKQDPLLEKFGFDSKGALTDYLLALNLSRSEKRLVEKYKSGSDLSGRQLRSLTALLEKHKGTQVAAASKQEEQTSVRRRAGRERPESARRADRSARGGEPAARQRAARTRPESARSARSSERSARSSARESAREERTLSRKRGGEASARKSRYAESARKRSASARSRGSNARENVSAEGIEVILKGIDDGSIPELDASEERKSGRVNRGRTSARLAGQGKAEGTTAIQNFKRIGNNVYLAASRRFMWGNVEQCAQKCLENEWCDAIYTFNRFGNPNKRVCVYADDVDPARKLPGYYKSWNFTAYAYVDRTAESAKVAQMSELEQTVVEQSEVISDLSDGIEKLGPQIEVLEDIKPFVDELSAATARKVNADAEAESKSAIRSALKILNSFNFSWRKSARSGGGALVSAREVDAGGSYPKFHTDIESGKLAEYSGVTEVENKSRSGRRAKEKRNARISARTWGEGAVKGLSALENFKLVGSNRYINSYRRYSWGDEVSCAKRCMDNQWCDAFYTYNHPKNGNKVCVLNDDVDPIRECSNNKCRSFGLKVYVHNEFAEEDKRIKDLTAEVKSNDEVIQGLESNLESYVATVSYYENEFAPFFERSYGSMIKDWPIEDWSSTATYEGWKEERTKYRLSMRTAQQSSGSISASTGDVGVVRDFSEQVNELNSSTSETRRGIATFNDVFTSVDNSVQNVNDFKTGVDALKSTIDTGARLPKIKGAFVALQPPARTAQQSIGNIQTNACRMNSMLDTPRALLEKGDDMLAEIENKLGYIGTMAPEVYALITLAINCGNERYAETNTGAEFIAQLEETRDVYTDALGTATDIVSSLNYTLEDMEEEARETRLEISNIITSAPDYTIPSSLDILVDIESELDRSHSLCPWPTQAFINDLSNASILDIPGIISDYTVGKRCPSHYTHVGGGVCRRCRGGKPEGPCWLQGDCTHYCGHWSCFGYECKGTYPTKYTSCPSNSCDAVVGCIRLKDTVTIREMLEFADEVIAEIKDSDPTGLIAEVDGLIDDAVSTIVSQLGVGSVFDGLVPSWDIYSEQELNNMIAVYEGYLNSINSELDNLIQEMTISLRQVTEQIGTDAYNALLADYMCPSVEEKLTTMAAAFLDDSFSQFNSEVMAQVSADKLQAAWLGSRLGQKTTELQGKIDELESAYQDPYNAALSTYLAQFGDESGCPGSATASLGNGDGGE